VTAPPDTARSGVQVTALPAACGDCLVVEYSSDSGSHRLLVDGGLSSKYDEGLGAYLAGGERPPVFDVVVVTHVDRDHIDGVIRALDEGHLEYGDIWFNGRDEIDALLHGRTRGVRQGDALSELIPANKRNRVVAGDAIHVGPDGPASFVLPGGARCTILGPNVDRLERLFGKWPEPSPTAEDPSQELLDALEDPVSRGVGEFGRDSSVANGSSIAFLLETGGVSLLLTGDAFAGDLQESIEQVLRQRGQDRLVVDLFKLSHHGSRQNMSDELLDLVEPRAILVCTDGSKFRHPDEDALEKIRAHYPEVPVHFTDDSEIIRQRAPVVGSEPPTVLPVRLGLGPPPSA
jgi:beta-lactamase superfamily II metal-dependent hydrolase